MRNNKPYSQNRSFLQLAEGEIPRRASIAEWRTPVINYDLRCASAFHDCGTGHIPSERVFVPVSPAAGEDEGC